MYLAKLNLGNKITSCPPQRFGIETRHQPLNGSFRGYTAFIGTTSMALGNKGSSIEATPPWISLTAPPELKSEVGYWTKLIPHERAESLYQRLLNEVPWAQYDITVSGKTYAQPRLVAYYAKPELGTYTYSKLTLNPTPFTPLLLELKQIVEDLLGVSFNSALLNYYRGGADYMEWHADDETLYGLNPTIAIITFGSGRDFHMRNMKDHTEVHKFICGAGDVLVMRGGCQQTWEHTVPPNPEQTGSRISLTFRTIVAPETQTQ